MAVYSLLPNATFFKPSCVLFAKNGVQNGLRVPLREGVSPAVSIVACHAADRSVRKPGIVMRVIRKIITSLVYVAMLMLFVWACLWGFDQRVHGKEYWLIFAHIVPFLLVVVLGAGLILVISHWIMGRLERKSPRNG